MTSIKTKASQEKFATLRSGTLVLPVFEGATPSRTFAKIDEVTGGVLKAAIKSGEFSAGRESLLIQRFAGPGKGPHRVVLLGLGKQEDFKPEVLRRCGAVLFKELKTLCTTAYLAWDELPLKADQHTVMAQAFHEGAALTGYEFCRFKKAGEQDLKTLVLVTSRDRALKAVRRGLKVALAVVQGVEQARDLANLPGNFGQPKKLAAAARTMARKAGLRCRVLGRAEMKKLKMESLLSVSLGSPHEPQLIILEHNATRKDLPCICLVGKGLTFDSGGISIKPSADMDKMRYDKCGGTTVIGTMKAVAALNLPLRVVGLVPSSENMPGGDANKPGDVVKASNRKSIEILNTDAEGRLILADALVYAQRFKPDVTIDLATLTGACMVALGQHCCGLMTRDDSLARDLVRAGERAFERAWRLPLWDEYSEEMKGTTTDLKNLGGRYGGAITAGAFLEYFAPEGAWAHLDIAGVSWDDNHRPYNRGKGATGFGVRLLVEYLRSRAS